jgi:hypothetical protein
MNRPLLAAAGAVALALVASACSVVQPDAARVDGTNITQSDFEDQLKNLKDDPQFIPSQPITNTETGALNNEWVRNVLWVNAFGIFAKDQNEAAGVAPPTDDAFEQTVRTQTATIMGIDPGSGQWASVAEANRKPVEDNVAQILTLFNRYRSEADDPAQVQAFYDQQPDRFARLCARHILVPTQGAAEDVKRRLDAGEDFGTVAADVSTDGSAADGGLLYTEGQDCPTANTYVQEFVDGALATPVGDVSDPVQTQFGWHVIVTDKLERRSFDEAKAEVAEYMRSTASQRAVADFGDADVWVNPRFGVWDVETGFIDAPAAGPTQR